MPSPEQVACVQSDRPKAPTTSTDKEGTLDTLIQAKRYITSKYLPGSSTPTLHLPNALRSRPLTKIVQTHDDAPI